MRVEIVGLDGIPEIRHGADLAALIRAAAAGPLAETIVVIAQKVVSKAEGAIVDLRSIEPSPFAAEWAGRWNRDARLVELVLRESRRIVKMERGLIIAETRHGWIAANAGVDQSNIPGDNYATVLPRDADASARRLHGALECGGVIVSDTFGRPWREGLTNVAIGAAGIEALEDYRGRPDYTGHTLHSTIVAIADEIAAAAGLVMRKEDGVPVALVRGIRFPRSDGSARDLIRSPERDLFR